MSTSIIEKLNTNESDSVIFLDKERNNKKIIVCFNGAGEQNDVQFLGIHDIFAASQNCLNFDVLLLYDNNQKYYTQGIPEYSSNDSETAGFLRGLILGKSYSSVYLLGVNDGGFQSIQQACYLKSLSCLDFINVLTFSCPSNYQNLDDNIKDLILDSNFDEFDLVLKLQNLNRDVRPSLKIRNIYSTRSLDVKSKQDFSRVSSSKYITLKNKTYDTRSLSLASFLKRTNRIENMIYNFLFIHSG